MVAHEIGHHVQDLLGILDKVDNMQAAGEPDPGQRASRYGSNCRPTAWPACGPTTRTTKWKILQPGDVEKALATAQAIGDDRLQTAARGYAVPDSFTHGSSAQRQKWLTTGLKSGDINDCDTFSN